MDIKSNQLEPGFLAGRIEHMLLTLGDVPWCPLSALSSVASYLEVGERDGRPASQRAVCWFSARQWHCGLSTCWPWPGYLCASQSNTLHHHKEWQQRGVTGIRALAALQCGLCHHREQSRSHLTCGGMRHINMSRAVDRYETKEKGTEKVNKFIWKQKENLPMEDISKF